VRKRLNLFSGECFGTGQTRAGVFVLALFAELGGWGIGVRSAHSVDFATNEASQAFEVRIGFPLVGAGQQREGNGRVVGDLFFFVADPDIDPGLLADEHTGRAQTPRDWLL
jgi:hypothetical protein